MNTLSSVTAGEGLQWRWRRCENDAGQFRLLHPTERQPRWIYVLQKSRRLSWIHGKPVRQAHPIPFHQKAQWSIRYILFLSSFLSLKWSGPEFSKILMYISFDLSYQSEKCDWLRIWLKSDLDTAVAQFELVVLCQQTYCRDADVSPSSVKHIFLENCRIYSQSHNLLKDTLLGPPQYSRGC